jgi:hypothetical protein
MKLSSGSLKERDFFWIGKNRAKGSGLSYTVSEHGQVVALCEHKINCMGSLKKETFLDQVLTTRLSMNIQLKTVSRIPANRNSLKSQQHFCS